MHADAPPDDTDRHRGAGPGGAARPDRRPATEAEAKALASPLRWRILRMTVDEPLTNQEIAERLGRHPASVLHHVRTLVATGFLAPGEPRRAGRGARRIPYRATGKSWQLELGDDVGGRRALVEAFVEDSPAAQSPDSRLVRLGLRLTDDELAELSDRLAAVIEDYAGRPPTPDGRPWSLFLALHPDPTRT